MGLNALGRLLCGVLLLGALSTGCSSSALPAWPDGQIDESCAPWDGAAFLVLTTREDGQYVRLTGFDSLTHAQGRWPIKMGGKQGEGSATICTAQRTPSACLYGKSGHFSITKVEADTFDVSFDGTFVRGNATVEVSGHFRARHTARPAPGASSPVRMLCG